MKILIIISFLLISNSNAFCNIIISSETIEYRINDIDNYTETYTIEGSNLSNEEKTFYIPIDELSILESVEVYEFRKGKKKASKIGKSVSKTQIEWNSFYTGVVKYRYIIPPFSHFQFIFRIKGKNTIFLTRMYSNGFYDSDKVNYSFELPEELRLTTSLKEEYSNEFNFTGDEIDSLSGLFYLIHPANQKPSDYFSQWFEHKISPLTIIKEENVPKELIQLSKTATKRELAEACFYYVQKRIKYIDIENGINALIPRQCEAILSNALGDCKDMATVLVSLYHFFDIEAYSAISRTKRKEEEFNFPSIGYANHMICALKLEDEFYFLDATEDACIFGDPSSQILGTEVFLIGYSPEYFVKIPNSPRSNSTAHLNYTIDIEKERISLTIQTFGKMNVFFYNTSLKSNDVNNKIKKAMGFLSGFQWEIDSTNILLKNSTIFATLKITPSMYSSFNQNILFEKRFIPSIESINLLFFNYRYPIYNSQIQISLKNLKGKITENNLSSTDEIVIEKNENQIKYSINLKEFDELEHFTSSLLYTQLTQLFNQSIILTQ